MTVPGPAWGHAGDVKWDSESKAFQALPMDQHCMKRSILAIIGHLVCAKNLRSISKGFKGTLVHETLRRTLLKSRNVAENCRLPCCDSATPGIVYTFE
jgi:hypothetical protein